jgi:hypothetical protein
LAERVAQPTGFVFEAWTVTRTVINILLIIALVVISFSNITRISLDTYTIKRALPNLLIGIILANASLFIIRYLADIATVVIYFFVEQTGTGTFVQFIKTAVAFVGIKTIAEGQNIPVVGELSTFSGVSAILLLLIGLVVLIGAIWLIIILYVRLAVIYLLTILSPLAFVSYGIPGLGKYFTQWWQLFTKWLFVLPAMCAVFWLMIVIGKSGEPSLIRTVLTYILFFFALSIPTKWGGAVVGKTNSILKNNPLSKFATDQARMAGELAIAKSPVGRVQEWAKLNKQNMENRIKLAREGHAAAARKGRSGRVETSLTERLGGAENDLAAIKDKNLNDFRRDPNNRDLLDKLKIKELYKNEMEKRKSEAIKKHADDFDSRKDTNEGIKKAIEDLAAAVADEEVIAGELKRAEGITNGNAMNALYQLPQLLNNYLEATKHIEFLESEKKKPGVSAARIKEIDEDIKQTTAQMQSMELSYKNMASDKNDKAKVGDVNLGVKGMNLGIREASKLMDKDSDLAKKYSSAHRLAVGQQRQALKSFNAGIMAQIKDEVKEQTVPQLQRELDDFLTNTLGKMDLGEIKKNTGLDLTHDQIKKAYFEGNNALLSAIGVKNHEVRNGRVIAEKFKTIEKSINDIRHADASLAWMEATNSAMREAGSGPVYSSEDIRVAKEGNNGQKKILSAKITSNGAMSGTPGYVVQRGENVDAGNRNYTVGSKKAGRGGNQASSGESVNQDAGEDDEEVIDESEPEEEEENK